MSEAFARFANATARLAGHPATFFVCCAVVLAWAASGPFFGFSETWQLIINTGTTIITFLMVFVIQNSQNRDGSALQAKLDELIRSSAARNSFIGIENLSQEEVDAFRRKCERAVRREIGKTGSAWVNGSAMRSRDAAAGDQEHAR
jgi:low affinity Fe/Cu permease